MFCLSLVASKNVYALPSMFDSISGNWDSFDEYVSFGQCSFAPSYAQMPFCNPARLQFVKNGTLEYSGILSATESVLSLSQGLMSGDLNSDFITDAFDDYNYSEALISARINYTFRNLTLGIRPVRLYGQFQLHNPNLPMGSMLYRDDLNVFMGAGFGFKFHDLSVSAGATGTILRREEYIAETTLVNFSSQLPSDFLFEQKRNGVFGDAGVFAEMDGIISGSFLIKDFGRFLNGETRDKYLFIRPDRETRVLTGLALVPKLWAGQMQIGGELFYSLIYGNVWNKQWLGTLSYYVGPTKLLSSFRPGFLRTGLSIRFSAFEVAVAQEWINKIETGRSSQPRFTLGLRVGL